MHPRITAHLITALFLLIYFWILVITAVDNALFYAVFPYRWFVAVALMVLLVLLPGRQWRLKLGLFLILCAWFSLLPRVSWHADANFFINAGRLHKGMTVDQAIARMKPFVMTARPDGRELWFQPAPQARDMAIAEVRQGKLRRVVLRRD